jgi:hypothetical protein
MEVNKTRIMRNPTMNLDKNYSYYLYEPELKKRHQKAIPNELMYRYFPSEKDILIKNKNPKDNYRYIFNGMKKTDYEEEKLEEFNKYIKEKENQKNIKFLPDWWLESDTLRYLQAANYDIKKVYTLIKENLNSTDKAIKIIDKRIRFILNYGFLYMYGRDVHFRPIIVVEVKRSCELLDKLSYTFEELNQAMLFFMNYIVNYILLPGQIENWILICDLKDVGIGKLPQFKNILSSLSKFRGRVFRNYILNLGGLMRAAASSFLSLLGSNSAKKIVMVDGKKLDVMQEFIRKENLQIKHGGTAPDVEYGGDNLFPPVVPSDVYNKEEEELNIVSPEEYKEMCLNSNPFRPFVINESYNRKWKKEEEQIILRKRQSSKMKQKISGLKLSLNDFIVEFENTNMKKILKNSNLFNKYKPKKLDLNCIKYFFEEMKNINNKYNNS